MTIKVKDKVWIIHYPNFYGIRVIETEVVRIGRKYFYVQATTDDMYKNHTIRLSRATMNSPGEYGSWKSFRTEAECVAEFERYIPFREVRDHFLNSLENKNYNQIVDDDLILCGKIMDTINQHNKGRKQ